MTDRWTHHPLLRKTISVCLVGAMLGGVVACSGSSSSASSNSETTWQKILNTHIVRVGFTNEAPYSVASPDKTTGIDPDIMTAFLKANGVTEVDGVLMEFGSLIPALQANRIDVITAGLWMNPDRCKQIAFSDPTTQVGQGFAVKKGNPFNVHSYKDVAASTARFGANTGGLEFTWADIAGIPKANQIQFPDLQTSIAALQAGRVDVISNNTFAIADYLSTLNDPSLEYVPLTTQPVDQSGKSTLAYSSFGFRSGDADFVAAFNKWIATEKSSGDLLKIVSKYGITADAIPSVATTAASICGTSGAGSSPS
jgi:polar amino acid transport system substrate-binding protein